jgi:hypothetical protein
MIYLNSFQLKEECGSNPNILFVRSVIKEKAAQD